MRFPLPITSLLLAVLAVWRVTHLLNAEDGPADVFVRLRRLVGSGLLGRLMDCFYCLSLWVALPFAWALGGTTFERALLWFGLSGGAILLERATDRAYPAPPPAFWQETHLPENQSEEDKDNVVLRQ